MNKIKQWIGKRKRIAATNRLIQTARDKDVGPIIDEHLIHYPDDKLTPKFKYKQAQEQYNEGMRNLMGIQPLKWVTKEELELLYPTSRED